MKFKFVGDTRDLPNGGPNNPSSITIQSRVSDERSYTFEGDEAVDVHADDADYFANHSHFKKVGGSKKKTKKKT